MCNGCIVETLTSVDVQGIVMIGGKLKEIYQGVIYREKFKVSPFKKAIDKLFELGQKYEDENIDVMQLLVKLIMNCFCEEKVRKDIKESYESNSEAWMMAEYDERVLDYRKFNHGIYTVKLKDDAGLEDEVKIVNTMPPHLGVFVLSNSKRIMNSFLHAIGGFHPNDIHYKDTDSLYIENNYWDKLDKAGSVVKNRAQCKNDYKDGGI